MSKSNAVLRADSSRVLRKRNANVDQTLRAVFKQEFRDAVSLRYGWRISNYTEFMCQQRIDREQAWLKSIIA